MKLRNGAFLLILLCVLFIFSMTDISSAKPAFDTGFALPNVNVDMDLVDKNPVPMTLQIMLYLTMLTLIPYIYVSCTAFIRVTIVLSFLKANLGITHGVPKQVWAGISLILTLYIMAPVFAQADVNVFTPARTQSPDYRVFLKKLQKPVTDFMKKNTRMADLKLFVGLERPKNPAAALRHPSFYALLAAFMISEMKTGFYIGFVLYLPFLIIDMIVAASLMSMGMFMLSPMGFSVPCKLLCFTMIDGFNLLIEGLIKSYNY